MGRALVTVLLALWSSGAAAQGTRFSARTELVLIDVAVVDRTGVPVKDLGARDFVVRVANRPRQVHSAEFVSAAPPEEDGSASGEDTVSNTRPTSGRLLLLVVDEANLRIGPTQGVLQDAEGLLAGLAPGDLVGLTRLPDGGGVEFTTDRARVREALRQVTGRPPRPAQLGLHVFLSEALDYEEGARHQWPRALTRECGLPTDPTYRQCVKGMELEATSLLREETLKTTVTVDSLLRLMKGLEAVRRPVTLVLVSEGLYIGRDPGALRGLAAAGAAGRVSLQIVRPVPPVYQPGQTTLPIDPATDDALRATGLENLASQFRGGFYPVVGTGASAFDRITTEMSNYYLLGIEPTEDDRTGRPREVRVEVQRPGVTVKARHRREARVWREHEPGPPDEQLRRLLTSLVPAAGLPVTMTSRVMAAGDNEVRVLISAELGDPVRQPSPMHVGFVVIDRTGAVVQSQAARVTLSPSRTAVPSPALFTTAVVLPPGEYSVRLAASDGTGTSGSVHQAIRARLRQQAGDREVSDLVVSGEPPPGAFPIFIPSAVIDGSRVAAAIEVRSRESGPGTLGVRFEVTSRGRATALAAAEAEAVARPAERKTLFSRVLALDHLPAGEYVVHALLTADGVPAGTLQRTFRLEPGEPLLTTTSIRQAIEDLQRHAPVSPALRSFVEQATAGILGVPPDADARPVADVAMVTFVAGLAALRDGRLAAARALFEQTRRSAPGFAGIEPYLQRSSK